MTTTPQTITNLGTGGTDLNATNGSSASADSNDSKFLDWPGDNRGSYLYFTGVSLNYCSVPDEAALRITGDLDIRVHAALDDWTPSATAYFLHKFTAGQAAYRLSISTSGRVVLNWSTDGTATTTATSTVSPTVADGAALWIRATLDVDNGAAGYDVKFYTSSDGGSTWTQLGTTVTGAGVTSIFAGTSIFEIGRFSSNVMNGSMYQVTVMSGIAGTTVLDVDTSVITSGAASSFTAITGQTVTIARSTTGRKTVAVVSPVHLFGTDDYWEIADNALLDFTATDSFTLIAVIRTWATLATNDAMIAKKADTTSTTAGWALTAGGSTAAQAQIQGGDGTNGTTAVSGSRTSGQLSVVAAVRNVSADTFTTYLNGTAGTPVTDATTATLANTSAVRIGRLAGAGSEYSDFEVVAVAVLRRALTATEIGQITTYYQARLS